MHTRSLGRTGVQLSEVSLGTWGLAAGSYGLVPTERFEEVVRHAIEHGITTIDMAPAWGGGQSERVVARVVGSRRDRMQYITRGGLRDVGGKVRSSFATESLIEDCEESLERLSTDHIDVWLLHNPSVEELRKSEWREAAKRLVDHGKIRAWGVSVGSVAQARLALSANTQALCLVHNILASKQIQQLDGEIWMSACGVLSRSPLAYGLLAGEWAEDVQFLPRDHRSKRWSRAALRARITQVGLLRFLLEGNSEEMAGAAIRYVLSNRLVTSTLVGARTPEQVAHAASCSHAPPYLSDEELARIPQVLASAGAFDDT